MDSEKMVACESAPPVKMSRYSRKFPLVAFWDIQSETTDVSRNGTTTEQPKRKIMIMNNVYKSFLRMSLILQASLSVLNTLHHLSFSASSFNLSYSTLRECVSFYFQLVSQSSVTQYFNQLI